MKNPRRLSNDGDHSEGEDEGGGEGASRRVSGGPRGAARSLAPGWPSGPGALKSSGPGALKSPPHTNGGAPVENSNSSWAEMELNVVGHFEIYPVSLQVTSAFCQLNESLTVRVSNNNLGLFKGWLYNDIREFVLSRRARSSSCGC